MTLPESLFAPWETFYVIVGSSGGALTGLLFVVVALVADKRTPATDRGLSAFTTPSIFHFVLVMAIAALVTMPRHGLMSLSVLLGGCAAVGASPGEVRRGPVEDWVFHGVAPGLCYAGLLVAAITLRPETELALYLIASATLLLLFIGIHNAWDVALYSATNLPRREDAPPPR